MSDPQTGSSMARGAASTLIGQATRLGVQTLSIIVLARLLDPRDFGLLAMVTSIIGVVAILSDAGLSLAALQAVSLTQQQRTNLFWANTFIGFVLAVALGLASGPIAAFYGEPLLQPVTMAMASTFFLTGLGVQFRAHVNRQLRFTAMAIIDGGGSILALALAVALALARAGVWSLVAQQIVPPAVALIAFIFISRWQPGLPRREAGSAAHFRFGLNTLLVQILNYLSVNIPSILLGRFWGANVLGQYNRAYTVFTLPMTQLAAPITRVVLPVLSRLENRARLQGYLEKAAIVITYSIGGLFAFLAAAASPLVHVVLGPAWVPTIPLLQILAIGGVFQALGYVYYWAFLITGKTNLQLKLMIPTRIVMIGLGVFGSFMGAVGVAWAITAGLALVWLVYAIWVRLTGLNSLPMILTSLRPLAVLSVAAGSTATLQIATESFSAPLELVISVAAFIGILGLALLVPLVRRDFRFILRVLKTTISPRGSTKDMKDSVNDIVRD